MCLGPIAWVCCCVDGVCAKFDPAPLSLPCFLRPMWEMQRVCRNIVGRCSSLDEGLWLLDGWSLVDSAKVCCFCSRTSPSVRRVVSLPHSPATVCCSHHHHHPTVRAGMAFLVAWSRFGYHTTWSIQRVLTLSISLFLSLPLSLSLSVTLVCVCVFPLS